MPRKVLLYWLLLRGRYLSPNWSVSYSRIHTAAVNHIPVSGWNVDTINCWNLLGSRIPSMDQPQKIIPKPSHLHPHLYIIYSECLYYVCESVCVRKFYFLSRQLSAFLSSSSFSQCSHLLKMEMRPSTMLCHPALTSWTSKNNGL